ncbi:18758_t:CDS:2, partial [Funneliformis geosporum]
MPLNFIEFGRLSSTALRLQDRFLIRVESACGSRLIIEENVKIVRTLKGNHQSVRAKVVLENKYIFEWDVIIEKHCTQSFVGEPVHYDLPSKLRPVVSIRDP